MSWGEWALGWLVAAHSHSGKSSGGGVSQGVKAEAEEAEEEEEEEEEIIRNLKRASRFPTRRDQHRPERRIPHNLISILALTYRFQMKLLHHL